jgi:hypothetical protein
VEHIAGLINNQEESGLIQAFLNLVPGYRPSEEIEERLLKRGKSGEHTAVPINLKVKTA